MDDCKPLLDGVVSAVKLCGDYFGNANNTGTGNGTGTGIAIPMLSATVGIPEWSMGAGGKTLKAGTYTRPLLTLT